MMNKSFQSSRHFLWTLFNLYRGQFIGLLIVSLIQVGLTIYLPIWIGTLVDQVVQSEPSTELFRRMGYIFGVIITSASVQWLIPKQYDQLLQGLLKKIRQQGMSKVYQATIPSLSCYTQGDMTSRLTNDMEQLAVSLTNLWQQCIVSAMTIGCMMVVMTTLDVFLMLVIVGLTPLSLYVARFIARKSYRFVQEQLAQKGSYMQFVEETLRQCDTVQLYDAMDTKGREFQQRNAEYSRITRQAVFYQSLVNPVTRGVNAIVYALVVVVGLWRLSLGNITLGELTAFLQYATNYTRPLNDIVNASTDWQTAQACLERMLELLSLSQENVEQVEALPYIADITFDGVTFGYDEHKLLFNDLSFTIQKGEKVAIIGPTGAGKSSVIQLLLKLYSVQKGDIRLSGVSIQDIDSESLYQQMGVVFQQTWLPSASVHDIIAYGNPTLTRQEVEEVAQRVGADYFIRQLPQGYDTEVDADQSTLSQGQQQLLAIARVMACNPSCIIVDEATSALDTRTELLVQEALDTLMAQRTSIIIAHRLKTIRNADKIIILDQGKIVAQGTHSQLLQGNQWYRQLHQD